MTDRALLFLASVAAVAGAIGVTVWLIATGQLGTFDGNFLLVSSMVMALAFGLYLRSMVGNAMRTQPPKPEKSPAPSPVELAPVLSSKIGNKPAP